MVVEKGKIAADNQALIQLSLLGEYKLSAEGVWRLSFRYALRSQPNQRSAMVTFNALTIKASQFFAQSDWILSELKIPVLDFLRSKALWITSYLDQDIRIGKGSTGNLFVFRRC